ncbi:MAG TPA: site-specific integrase [Thermoanaerobaculia bacterium]|nr:site-specific integrase [Thermoanaerobaculia bacterium]
MRLKGQPPQTATFTRKTDALLWAQRVEADIRAGRHFPGNEARKRTLAELIERYRREVLPQYGRREQKQRSSKLAWWSSKLGTRLLSDLTPAAISEAKTRLAGGEGPSGKPASPATQVRYLAALRHVLAIAKREWQWVGDNPAQQVRAPREPRGRLRYLSEEERDRLLEACKASDDPRLYPFVIVALGTGARRGEVVGLRWRDIDLQRGTATLQETKNSERRTLVLAGRVLEVLRELGAVRRIDTDEVFTGRHGIAAFPRKPWDAALKRAKIEDFHFHDLRHTFASHLAMSGATLAELAEALGHKTLAMVKRYAHLSEQHTSHVVGRYVERFLG